MCLTASKFSIFAIRFLFRYNCSRFGKSRRFSILAILFAESSRMRIFGLFTMFSIWSRAGYHSDAVRDEVQLLHVRQPLDVPDVLYVVERKVQQPRA
jgi:hypothetical protein